VKWAFLLTYWGDIGPCVDAMFDDRRIEVRNLCILPGTNISLFLKEGFVSCEFLKGACNTYSDFFYASWFHGNVDFDSGGNVGHVTFFKIIRSRDRVTETIYVP
jgi:hypothetical protein